MAASAWRIHMVGSREELCIKNRTGIVIELKYAEDGDMDAACIEALNQIEKKDYVAKLKQDGMRNFIKYGIACYKKDCKVVIGK